MAALGCLCLCLCAGSAAAERLVEVGVIVRNQPGTAAASLTRDDFRIFAGGQPKTIERFEAHSSGGVRQPVGVTAILLDGLNTRIEDGAAARRQLLKFLGQIQPADRVEIYLMGTHLQAMQPLPAGVDETMAAFNGTDIELRAYGPPERLTHTLDQLVQLARHMGRVAGRKNLIWLSGGFPLTPWDGDPKSLSAEMARAARVLSDSGIAIYPVDAGALFAPRKRRAGSEALDRLAALTGGRAFTAPDDVLQVVHAVLDESAVSYTLGFAAEAAPAAPTTLEFRDLRIETTRGLQLAYPRGYLAGPVPQPAAGSEREIASVLTSPVESREIALRVELQRIELEGKPALKILGRIPGTDIALQPEGTGFTAAVDISCHQLSAEGRDLGSIDFPVSLTLNAAQAQQLRQTGGTWSRSVRPSPQATQLRIAAYDRNSGRAGSVFGALPRPNDSGEAAITFRAESNLALVRFQVSPKKGEFVTDLRPEDIVVKEDGAPQKIAVFEGGRLYPRKVPVEITLLFDCSGSMNARKLIDPQVFGPSLLDEFENVKIAIYGFSNSLVRLTTPTRDPAALRAAADGVSAVPHGGTPPFRTIGDVAREAAGTPGDSIRTMVIFSDGEASTEQDSDLWKKTGSDAQELGVTLYPIALAGDSSQYSAESGYVPPLSADATAPASARALLWATSRSRFAELGKRSGGQSFEGIVSGDVLPRILRILGRQIRLEYVVGYYHPEASSSGKHHQATVTWSGAARGEILGGTRVVVY